MADRYTTKEEVGRKATYAKAVLILGGGESAPASEAMQQRTVVTSLTEGCVSLRYAPRNPKASEPVDTAS